MALLYGTLNVLQLISDGCHMDLNCRFNFITVFWCNSLKNKTESLKSKWAKSTEYTLWQLKLLTGLNDELNSLLYGNFFSFNPFTTKAKIFSDQAEFFSSALVSEKSTKKIIFYFCALLTHRWKHKNLVDIFDKSYVDQCLIVGLDLTCSNLYNFIFFIF
jgi:hypothetical protein